MTSFFHMAARFSRSLVTVRLTLAVLAAMAAGPLAAQEIIAHRGASGERPEHTLAAYELAIAQGADWIEPDLVVTKDAVLIARHDTDLSQTTDVGSREEFADRRRGKTIAGELVNGWFAEDFTLAEIRTLRAKERLAGMRPANARFDGLYSVPTFAEVLKLVRAKEAETGRRIGVMPELKHPTYLLQDGFDTVQLVLNDLAGAGYAKDDAHVAIQSFDIAPLKRLDAMSDFMLVQLVGPQGGPQDEPGTDFSAMIQPAGLAEVASYADVLAPEMTLLFTTEGAPTGLVEEAHEAGLRVFAWTLRKENAFLPPILKRGTSENGTGDLLGMVSILKAHGVDGIFTDDPGLAVSARKELVQ